MLGTIKNWITKIFASTPANPAEWFKWGFGGQATDSGIEFTSETPLTYSPVWYAVNKIAGHVASMPLKLHKRVGDRGREEATDHPAYYLMESEPNDWLTAPMFKETLTAHALLWGNGRAAITRNGNNQPLRLDILDPAKTNCVVIRNTETSVSEKFHVYRDAETNDEVRWADRDVLHIQGLGTNGFQGLSLITLARNSWGGGLAAEKTTNKLFKSNAVPDLILEAPAGVFRKQEDAEEFLKKFKEHHHGGGGIGLTREGITAKPLTMSGRDAQWIEQRKFQRQEAALWFLLEQILGDDSSVSYNSLEQKNLAYLTNCLLRWLIKWEFECRKKLLTRAQKRNRTHFFKFTTSALMRSTAKDRAEVQYLYRQMEVLSADDVRVQEDMNPREDGGGGDYANPAINPKDKDADGDLDDTFKNTLTESREAELSRIRTMVKTRLETVVKDEVSRVREAAGKHLKWIQYKNGDFINWMDKFYPSFESRLSAAVGDASMAQQYVEESRSRLLEVAGAATHEELADMVTTETETWIDRVAVWTNKIMEQHNG